MTKPTGLQKHTQQVPANILSTKNLILGYFWSNFVGLSLFTELFFFFFFGFDWQVN